MKKIGERIKTERKRLGLTQKDLLSNIYMSETSTATLRRWEQGKDLPDLKTLVYMSELFECDVGYLIADYDQRHHVTADICAATGLSEIVVNRLINTRTYPISGAARRKDGKMYLISTRRTINALFESKHINRFLYELTQYLRFSGNTAEEVNEDDDFFMTDELYQKTINFFRKKKCEIISRRNLAEMYLQSSADTLKMMFREIQEDIVGGSDNGKKK